MDEPSQPADKQPSAPIARLPRRRWLGLVFWALVVGGLCWLWVRSESQSDLFVGFSSNGTAHGVLSHRGHLAIAFSTISFGPEKAWTVDSLQATLDQGDDLFHNIYTNASVFKPFFMFGYSEGRKGDIGSLPDASWSAFVLPHWSAVTFCSIIFLWHVRRFLFQSKERRWRKQGRCLACGYDLQGTPSDRCPECGTAVQG